MSRKNLTGPWAGFYFEGPYLVSPEGHRWDHTDLAWLSLTCNIAREWRTAMEEARGEIREKRVAKVAYMRDRIARRRQLASARHVQRG
ncbi:DUF3653 domain-containing protein [Pseudoxanthomonas winnipegensis]|uniref:DUF3653 domain-containing protein n=1 Tax=Pseudoxanthomonas winnipegensis TaxID=2480810 RepID=UPI00102D8C88|nr:DUF3653 domain-containing protein [Pseudoxanthomonas winnipegensis]TAA08853.1 hypothetical protein EA659_13460 [Pseudoxanthomonas winnipegensis]TAH71793.1 hypothetical protein EA657_11765 [Pseudoxanthomonas winnipegensis]